MNLTSSITPINYDGSASWFTTVIIVGIVAILLTLFIIALSSVTRYKKFKGFILWLVLTFQYFLVGVTSLVVLAFPTLVIYYFGKQAAKGNVVPIWVTSSLIVGYFLISFIGWLSKKLVVDRILSFEEELVEEVNRK